MSGSMKKGGLIHDAAVLFVITVIAALALGFVYELTKDPIEQAQAQAKIDAYRAVFPDMYDMKSPKDQEAVLERANASLSADKAFEGVVIDEILEAQDGSGNLIGWVMTVTSSKGYGGNITMTVGVGTTGVLHGVEFLSLSETPGLGMNAKEEGFKSQFREAKVGQYSLAKRNISGDTEINAISSATITTTAVTRSVNAALKTASDLAF